MKSTVPVLNLHAMSCYVTALHGLGGTVGRKVFAMIHCSQSTYPLPLLAAKLDNDNRLAF